MIGGNLNGTSGCSFLLFLCYSKALKFTLANQREFQSIKMANQKSLTTENITELKQIIEKLTNTVTKQNLVIQNLTDLLKKLENIQITSGNKIYQLEK